MTTDTPTSVRPSTTGSTVTHVTPQTRDLSYNPASDQAALSVYLHLPDGRIEPSLLVLEPGQMEMYRNQLTQALSCRASNGQADEDRQRAAAPGTRPLEGVRSGR